MSVLKASTTARFYVAPTVSFKNTARSDSVYSHLLHLRHVYSLQIHVKLIAGISLLKMQTVLISICIMHVLYASHYIIGLTLLTHA